MTLSFGSTSEGAASHPGPGLGRRWAATAPRIVFGVLLGVEVYLAGCRVVGLPHTPQTPESFVSDDLAKGYRISQTMTVRAGGFTEILLSGALVGTTPIGQLQWALYEIQRDEDGGILEQMLYRDEVSAAATVANEKATLTFPEIADSRGRSYRLDIWPSTAYPAPTVGLLASHGRWSGGGSMFVNGQSVFAELVFETRATRATVWTQMRHRYSDAGLALVLLLAAVAHAAFFLVVCALTTLPSSALLPGTIE